MICFLCDKSFDPDELQQFQPGFEMNWKLNLVAKQCKKVTRSQTTTESNSTIRDTNASLGQAEIIVRPPEPRLPTRLPLDGHICQYDEDQIDGICSLCLKAHDSCVFMNKHLRCEVCHRIAEPCPEEESKSFYLVNKLLDLHKSHQRRMIGRTIDSSLNAFGNSRPLKVIVFSQFRQTLNSVGDRLLRRFGGGCIAEYFGQHRSQELHKFTSEASCFCLLLTKDGAEGLDLSFVTNIMFLDEIYDKSLRDQAVARAWRMGAKGSVKVETLVAKHSVEATLGEMDSTRKDAPNGAEKDRIKKLLLSLRLNTDYHYFAGRSTDDGAEAPYKPSRKRRQDVPSLDDNFLELTGRVKRVKFALA